MQTNKKWLWAMLVLGMVLVGAGKASTLDAVTSSGSIRCGVSTGLPGFSAKNADGSWWGLDADFCRAVAAAVLGDAGKVTYVPLKPAERLTALSAGQVDVLAHNTTWTMDRDLIQGVEFVGVNYYDGQGFMAPKAKEFHSALELDGVTVCVQQGTTSENNVKQYFTLHRMQFRLLTFDGPEAMVKAYADGQCDVLTSDRSQLFALRSGFEKPTDAVVLPEVISKEPLSPAVREGDANWLNIVRWTLFAMIDAEEQGISSRNIERLKQEARNPRVRHFIGLDGKTGEALGLDPLWIYRIIKQVGNYAESYERNLGARSPIKIKRGLNALWRDGGLMYAPPAR